MHFKKNIKTVAGVITNLLEKNKVPVVDFVIKIQKGDKRYFGVLEYSWRLYIKMQEDFSKSILRHLDTDMIATRGEEKIQSQMRDVNKSRYHFKNFYKNNNTLSQIFESIDATGWSPTSR